MAADDTPINAAPDPLRPDNAGRIRSFVERVERIDTEIGDLQADRAEVFKEAKAEGHSAPALRHIIARRAKDGAALRELDALVDLYTTALEGN